VYSAESPISASTVAFLFQKALKGIDLNLLESQPSCLFEVSTVVASLVTSTNIVTTQKSRLFLLKFPSATLLKFIGGFLACGVNANEAYDQAIAVRIATVVQLASDFEPAPGDSAIQELLATVLLAVETRRPLILAAFLSVANNLFAFNDRPLPTISRVALQSIPALDLSKLLSTQDRVSLLSSVCSLFLSASEVLRPSPDVGDEIRAAYAKVWEISPDLQLHFLLVCSSALLPSPIDERVADDLKHLSQFFAEGHDYGRAGVAYVVSLIEYVALVIVWNPGGAASVQAGRFVTAILSQLLNLDPTATVKIADYVRLVVAALHLLQSVVEWGSPSFLRPMLGAVLSFLSIVRAFVGGQRAHASDAPEDLAGRARLLFADVVARLNLHCPSHDHFTRTLGSSAAVDEAAVIQLLGLRNARVRYYTVAAHALVSVIDSVNNDSIALFARGPYGRTVWLASERHRVCATRLSTEIEKQALAPPASPPLDPVETEACDFARIPDADIADHDERFRAIYRAEFTSWVDWDEFGFFFPFGFRGGRLRPRIADFLATIGLSNGSNSNQVRAQLDGDAVADAVRRLDALETPALMPVLLTHVLASDASLEWGDSHWSRMTPLMQAFLREIGEPLAVPSKVAAACKLPPLRTPVPTFHCQGGLAAVLSPAMCEGSDGVAALQAQTPTVRLIFNETNFEIAAQMPPGPGAVLVVKPSLPGLYHVWLTRGLAGVFSPFAPRQLMCARSIAFGVAMLMQLAAVEHSPRPPSADRLAVISELCRQTPVGKDMGILAPQVYDDRPGL
jgi:hypothetical protein